MPSKQSYFQPSLNADNSIIEKQFPYLHPNISLFHLHNNGKLFSEDEISNILQFFDGNFRLKRIKTCTDLGNFYNILKLTNSKDNKNHFYAIYLGEKHHKHLGKGTFGKVKLIQDLETGEWHALKIQKNLTFAQIKKIYSPELNVLNKLNQTIGSIERSAEYNIPHLLAMHLLRGIDLASFLKSKPRLPESHWLQIATNISKAVYDFYQKKLLHNDLKPENIFINPVTYEIALLDFQFSLPGPHYLVEKSPSFGTPGYMALELMLAERSYEYNEKTEINALGITFGELFGCIFASRKLGTGIFEFAQRYRIYNPEKRSELSYRIFDKEITYCIPQRIPNKLLRAEICNFLTRMTDDNSKNRPTLDETHQFLTSLPARFETKAASIKKIGILNIEEYLNHDEKIQNELRLELKKMDEVWFIDTIQRDLIDYLLLRRELESEHIKIGEKIFYPSHPLASISQMQKQIGLMIQQDQTNFAYQQKDFIISKQPSNPIALFDLNANSKKEICQENEVSYQPEYNKVANISQKPQF
ncbi:MAG: hypothetical protein A3F11_06415 [Gammaproteobacteria bacterium RIFCSPHIGHO2_12_FULL_37_14]|nr:MAG: hypothetical protein A3F11_06415 [Gammaproteobacteria bacterium RIFCSPHIGHO2_12_FULL_37_14]